MISGIYSAKFESNKQVAGSGVVVFTGGALHGGDASYYYKGKYKRDENNNITATVDVANHSGTPSSVFGLLKSFRLTLNGIANGEEYTLTGQVEGQPTLWITISLRRVDDLVEG